MQSIHFLDTQIVSEYTDVTLLEGITWTDIKTTNDGTYQCCGWRITDPSDESCDEVEFNIKVYGVLNHIS